MKLISIISVLTICVNLAAQNPYEPVTFDENGNVLMQEVITADGKTTNDLYNAAKLWFGDAYNSSQDVLQVDNKEEGLIMGKAFKEITVPLALGSVQEARLWYSIKLDIKEGKYRLSLYDLFFQPKGDYGYTDKRPIEMWFGEKGVRKNGKIRKMTQVMRDEVNTTFEALKKSMDKKMNETKKVDDW